MPKNTDNKNAMDNLTEVELDFLIRQKKVCEKYNAEFNEAPFNTIIGVAKETIETFNMPINGLRHPVQSEGVTNWYIWAGENLSDAADFFKPMHIYHLLQLCPKAINYLGLGPGWRFLFDNAYEDVWYDEALLKI